MYSIKLIEVNRGMIDEIHNLYYHYFNPEKATVMAESIDNKYMTHACVCLYKDKIVGCMGINSAGKGVYNFMSIVTSKHHRRKGIAYAIIQLAVKYLFELGATKIVNHKRENVIKHQIFTDMGFKLINHKPNASTGYLYTYGLSRQEADFKKLERIWGNIDVKQK